MKSPLRSLTLAVLGCALSLATAGAQQFTQDQIARQKALYGQAQNDLARGQYAEAEAKARALIKARPGDPYMRQLLVRVQQAKLDAARRGAWEGRLKSLIVPSVNVDEATLEEVVQYVRTKAKELSGDPNGPNIILKGDIRDRLVTLRLTGVPLSEVLRFAGDLTGVRFDYQKHVIVGSSVRREVAEEKPAPKPSPDPEPPKADPEPPSDPFPAAVGFQSPAIGRAASF